MRFAALTIALMLFATAGQSAQADTGEPGNAMLAEMGLGGVQAVSHSEADAVRGSGYVWQSGAPKYRREIFKYHLWLKKYSQHTRTYQRRIVKNRFGYGYQATKRW